MLTACEQSAWHKEQKLPSLKIIFFHNICVSVFLLSCHNLTVNIAQFLLNTVIFKLNFRDTYLENVLSPLLDCWQSRIGNCLYQHPHHKGSPSLYQKLWHCSRTGHWINRVVSSFVCPYMEMWNVVGSFQSLFDWHIYGFYSLIVKMILVFNITRYV